MTIALHGLGVSRGIAIGKVHIIERGQLDIPEYKVEVEGVDAEIARLEQAVAAAKQQLRAIRQHIPAATATDITAFIDTHLLMLDDTALIHEPIRLIREHRYNAEHALQVQRDTLVSIFEEMDDAYLRTRRDDVVHVVTRIQRVLLKQSPLKHEELDSRLGGYVVLADDLTPADTVLMQHLGIAAFATEYGGPTSHTAILARSLGIPSIVGLHQARRYVREDDLVIVDGVRGIMLVAPDDSSLAYYRARREEDQRYQSELIHLKGVPARTRDGVDIELQANIELPRDFETVLQVGAAGVGLYRTEFLYMNRETAPAEEEHFQTYLQVIKILSGLPLTIRTFDLGADKHIDNTERVAPNPALGLRAIRLCLAEPQMFHLQLRAILRTSHYGKVRILIPMLSSAHELNQTLHLIDEAKKSLLDDGIPYDKKIKIGGMIEIPAAALSLSTFTRKLDFLSIGTNDLIQYTLAIDRADDTVAHLYDPLHPAVLNLVAHIIRSANRAAVPVAVCGEMAGDVRLTRVLLGFGLRQFSMHPAHLLSVKQQVLKSDLQQVMVLTQKMLKSDDRDKLEQLLNRMNG